MRTFTWTVLAVGLISTAPARGQEGAGRPIMADVRHALGGDSALNAVQALRGVGTATRAFGDLRIAGEVEVLLALPDRYLRTDRLLVGGLASEVVSGFRGEAFIQRASGPDGLRVDPGAALDPAMRAVVAAGAARGARHDLVRLLLGFFGSARGLLPLTFTHVGTAEAPDGTADVLQVDGSEGFAVRLFVDATTRHALMLAWHAPDVSGAFRRLTRMSADRSTERVDAAGLLAQAQSPVEHRMYFSDYRRVGRLTWPHRVRRSAAGEPREELVFERFWINPALDPRVFEPER
jgi:hypothetical protein